eukprot:scaffold214274_cov13-Tisochrysis_lutea.AAC.1
MGGCAPECHPGGHSTLGKHGELRPKSAAQVLLVELLDADFSPVWMRDVLVANETIALAEEAAACRAAKRAERRHERHERHAGMDPMWHEDAMHHNRAGLPSH